MATMYFKRKLQEIKYNYGVKASEYLKRNTKCEDCGEPRMLVLNIHHTQGKKIEEFKTLCHNCHMIEHSTTNKEYTHETYLNEEKQKLASDVDRDKRILKRLDEGLAIHKIITQENTSISSIKTVMSKHNFVSIQRKGYTKILH